MFLIIMIKKYNQYPFNKVIRKTKKNKTKFFFTEKVKRQLDADKDKIYIVNTNNFFVPSMLHKKVYCYNGKKFKLVKINRDIIGFRMGEIVQTRFCKYKKY